MRNYLICKLQHCKTNVICVGKKRSGNGSWTHMEENFLDLVLIAIKLLIKNTKAKNISAFDYFLMFIQRKFLIWERRRSNLVISDPRLILKRSETIRAQGCRRQLPEFLKNYIFTKAILSSVHFCNGIQLLWPLKLSRRMWTAAQISATLNCI